MESKFNRPFRSHNDDIKIRGYGSYTEDEIQVIKRDFAEYLTANYDEQRLGSLHLQSELGGDIDPKIDFILKELLSYFDNLGVGPVSCDEFFWYQERVLPGVWVKVVDQKGLLLVVQIYLIWSYDRWCF